MAIYDGRNPPKTKVRIGTHSKECRFMYNRKLDCIEVPYRHDTGRKTGEHRIDHVKVIDMRTHPREVIIDLDNQIGIISKKMLGMIYGSSTDKCAVGNIIAGEIQRKKHNTDVIVERKGNKEGVDVEIPSQRKLIEVGMCTNEKNLFTTLSNTEIKAIRRLRQPKYKDYIAEVMAIYIDKKNGHLKYIERGI